MSGTENPRRFTGRVAVVTGGASGIGEAIVRRLVSEGAAVAVGDLDGERLTRLAGALGESVATTLCDVTRESDVEALVELAVDRFGRLDAGFNVAGGGRSGMILDLAESDWDFVLDLNVKAVFLSMKHEARQFRAQGGGGAIVNVASVHAEIPMRGAAGYCTAKAGVAMLVRCGALEWGELGIRVNAVSPGLIDTPRTTVLNDVAGAKDAYLARIPLDTTGSPEEVAAAAAFLASDDASYITGANLVVDGGWSLTGAPDLRGLDSRWAQT